MKRHVRKLAVVGAATAVAAGVVIATSTAGGTSAKSGVITALETAAPAQLGDGTVNALKEAGFSARPDGAVRVTTSDGTEFRMLPGTDGGACLVSADGGATCGDAPTLVRSAIVGIRPDEEAAKSLFPAINRADLRPGVVNRVKPVARAGTIDVRGIAADNVTSVAVVTRAGDVLRKSTVENNVFLLKNVPFADAASVRVTRTDGTTGDDSLN